MTSSRLLLSVSLAAWVLAAVPVSAGAPATPPAGGVRMGTMPQEVLMTKITVSDLQKSNDFYTRIIGLKPVASSDMALPVMPKPGDPEKDFVEVAFNYSGSMADAMFVLMKRRGRVPTPEQAVMTQLVFKVPEPAAVMARAAAAGLQPARPGIAGGNVGFLRDPDGYSIEILKAPSYVK
jgi:catechol 2,3-dioxygenase-like lactoylglutathione lyase family enzyme